MLANVHPQKMIHGHGNADVFSWDSRLPVIQQFAPSAAPWLENPPQQCSQFNALLSPMFSFKLTFMVDFTGFSVMLAFQFSSQDPNTDHKKKHVSPGIKSSGATSNAPRILAIQDDLSSCGLIETHPEGDQKGRKALLLSPQSCWGMRQLRTKMSCYVMSIDD